MVSKEEIKNVIEKAFDGVTLGDGITLVESNIASNYGEGATDRETIKLLSNEIKKNWKEIPDAQLDDAEGLVFLDREGFRYYIPALMLRLLENYDSLSMMAMGTLSLLYPKKEDDKYVYEILTHEQKQAIALYMKSLPELVELNSADTTIAERAFDRYWSKYLS